MVDLDEMRRQRYTFDDLMLQLRTNNISSVFEVEYAILEANGELSAFKKQETEYNPLPIITSGGIEKENLFLIQKNEDWVKQELENQGIFSVKEVYYAAYDGEHLQCLTRRNLDLNAKTLPSSNVFLVAILLYLMETYVIIRTLFRFDGCCHFLCWKKSTNNNKK